MAEDRVKLANTVLELANSLLYDPKKPAPEGKHHPVHLQYLPSTVLLMGTKSTYGGWQDVSEHLDKKIGELESGKDKDAVKFLEELRALVKKKLPK